MTTGAKNKKQSAGKKRSRVKIGKLQKSTRKLTSGEAKKVRGGRQTPLVAGVGKIAMADGKVES